MTRPLILRRGAEADLVNIYEALEATLAGLGSRFVDHVRTVFERIESMPEMYGIVWQDVRAVRIRSFQYVLYYVVFADRVEVLAIIHGSREDSVWRSRLP